MLVLKWGMLREWRRDMIVVETMASRWVVRTGIEQVVRRGQLKGETKGETKGRLMIVAMDQGWVDLRGSSRVAQWVGCLALVMACGMDSWTVQMKVAWMVKDLDCGWALMLAVLKVAWLETKKEWVRVVVMDTL